MAEPADTHEITVPAEAASLKQVRAFLKPHLIAQQVEATDELILAIDEACANIVRHRSPEITGGDIHLRFDIEPGVVRFQLDAFCRASEMGKIKPRELDDVRPGGLGMHFIATIMDRVYFIPNRGHEGSVTLVMEKSRETSPTTSASPAPEPPAQNPHA